MNGWATDLVKGIIFIYFSIILILTFFAILIPEKRSKKITGACIVIVILIAPVFKPLIYYPIEMNIKWYRKYRPAKALFDERCMQAKSKTRIYKTVDDIEGILLFNIRNIPSEMDLRNPHWPDAGLPNERKGFDYIRSFLNGKWKDTFRNGFIEKAKKDDENDSITLGYSYVDVKEGREFWRYKYMNLEEDSLMRERSPQEPMRYAVFFLNIIDPEDRAHWVAGTTVVIFDTLTQEILAEKTWYSFVSDPDSIKEYTNYWNSSENCPLSRATRMYKYRPENATREFVEQVLKPKQEY